MSFVKPAAIEELDRALTLSLSFATEAAATVDAILDRWPNFALAYLAKASWLAHCMDGASVQQIRDLIVKAEGHFSEMNDREKNIYFGVKHWISGNSTKACERWSNILRSYPLDLMVLQSLHIAHVRLGNRAALTECARDVLPHWERRIPGYEFFLALYSFGLEENGDYDNSEVLARESLSIRSTNPYAIHTISHSLEMRGLPRAGQEFLSSNESDWANSGLAEHLWWHKSLYCIDIDDHNSALEIFDKHLISDGPENTFRDQDACALLWRLHLLKADIGERWNHMARKWQDGRYDKSFAFNNIHAMFALVGSERRAEQIVLLNELRENLNGNVDPGRRKSLQIGLQICDALQQFGLEDYDECIHSLIGISSQTDYLGGSVAQRDVIEWTYLEVASRARAYELALPVAQKRCIQKPEVLHNERYRSCAIKGLAQN